MAVHYVKGSDWLGNLGTVASVAGTLTGQPWLMALGTGMKGVDGLINGYSTPGFENQNNNNTPNLIGMLGGLFSSNIGSPGASSSQPDYNELAKKWGRVQY